jgi:hypothetical protein
MPALRQRASPHVTAGSSSPQPMPPGTESRMAEFTELAATAISNVEARVEVERLAEEQAALRRVATLLARDVHQRRCSPESSRRWAGSVEPTRR